MNATSNWLAPVLRNRMVLFILALALLVPLAFTPVSAHYPALGAALLEGCAIVLLSMLLWKADWRGGRDKVIEFVRAAPNVPVLLFMAVAGISCLMSPHKDLSVQELLRLGSGVVLYFAVAHHVRRSDQLSCLVDVILFLCCAISIAGFVQYDQSTGTFATGMFGDHQLFGSCLMALLPIAAAVAVSEKNAARQLFARAATVLAAAGLMIAHSRSAWIGGAAALTLLSGAAIVSMVRKHRSHLHVRMSEAVAPVAVLVIALAVFMFLWPQSSSILGRATTLSSVSTDSTWATRQAGWQDTIPMIKHAPFFGNGLGLFPYMHYVSGIGQSVTAVHMHPSLTDQAHNLYLQTAADLGIVGLLVFLAIPATLLTLGVRRAMNMDDGIRRTLLMGAMAATVGCLVDGLASPSWQIGSVSLFFWLLLGIVATTAQPNAKRERSAVLDRPQPVSRPVFAFASLGLAVLLPTAAMAVSLGYSHVVRCRLVPTTSTITGGQRQQFTFFATFADNTGNFTEEREVTVDPRTRFSFTTSQRRIEDNQNNDNGAFADDGGSRIGYMTGPNYSIYQSDEDGRYVAFVHATYTDVQGNTCTATAVVHVLRGRGHGDDAGHYIGYGIAGGGILWAIFAHHSSNDHFTFNDGATKAQPDTMQASAGTGIPDGVGTYDQPLPPDSLFSPATPAEKAADGKSGR